MVTRTLAAVGKRPRAHGNPPNRTFRASLRLQDEDFNLLYSKFRKRPCVLVDV